MAQPTHLIVGLGNPGSDYIFTRHNIGFMVLDALAESRAIQATGWQKKFQGQLATATCNTHNFLLLKPTTFMNLSGQSVGEALRFYKLTAPQVIVFHDDIDLESGRLKIKQGGGHGGHNGLKSLDAHIGKDYWRIRLGVGHPGEKDQVTNHVLGNFSKADQAWLSLLLASIPNHLETLLANKPNEFMQQVSRSVSCND